MAEFPYDLIEQENHGLEKPEPVELSAFVYGPQTGLVIPRPQPRRFADRVWAIVYWVAHVLAVGSILFFFVAWIWTGMGWWR